MTVGSSVATVGSSIVSVGSSVLTVGYSVVTVGSASVTFGSQLPLSVGSCFPSVAAFLSTHFIFCWPNSFCLPVGG